MFQRALATAPARAGRILSTAVRPQIASQSRIAPVAAQAVARRSYHEKDKSSLSRSLSRKIWWRSGVITPRNNRIQLLATIFLVPDTPLTYAALIDHYSNPRNVGSMSKADGDVGTGLVGAPACGDVMKLQIRVDPNSNTISDVKFKTFGCGSAIASSSYLTELVRGMSLDDAAKIRNTDIAKELCLPPVKCEYSRCSHNNGQ
jgi:Fe-S cluster assembly scaffold IscU